MGYKDNGKDNGNYRNYRGYIEIVLNQSSRRGGKNHLEVEIKPYTGGHACFEVPKPQTPNPEP